MPIHVVCDQCQSEYNLRDDLAGKKLRCKKCENILVVPVPEEYQAESYGDRGYHNAFARDRFLMKQKRIAISEKYYIFDEKQNPILFIERPAHFFRSCGALVLGALLIVVGMGISVGVAMALGGPNGGVQTPASVGAMLFGFLATFVVGFALIIWMYPKRHISVYTDDTKQELLLEVFQDRKLNILTADFTVRDPVAGELGRCKKVYIYNLFRKRWYVYAPDGTLDLLVREDSLIMSLLRRLLPPAITIFFARTNFIFQKAGDDRTLGEFNRKFTLFDQYVLDMSFDREHLIDRRMAIAVGVLLDTGERR